MTLQNLQHDMIAAMKSKDKLRKDTISSLIQAIKKRAIDEKCKDNITEDLITSVILKEQKTAQEMLDTCPADRTDLKTEYQARYNIISEYAPTLLTDEAEIESLITSLNIELTKSNMGKIMGALKGKCDMKVANQVVKKLL